MFVRLLENLLKVKNGFFKTLSVFGSQGCLFLEKKKQNFNHNHVSRVFVEESNRLGEAALIVLILFQIKIGIFIGMFDIYGA
jgi:hypothetical protein